MTEPGQFISPLDLDESELEFDDPDAPLVEEERPGLNATTKAALVAYQKDPSGNPAGRPVSTNITSLPVSIR